MKQRNIEVIILSLFCIYSLLSLGCATRKIVVPDRCMGQEEILIQSHPANRPKWMDVVPDGSVEIEYFIGHSSLFPLEKNARSDAMTDAINQFVKFCGIEVDIVDEYFKETEGKSSEVLDATQKRSEVNKMRAEAFVSRVKGSEWYDRRIKKCIYNNFQEGWFSSVIVTVPKDEINRVKKYALEKRKEREIEEQKAHLAKIKELKGKIRAAYSYYEIAHKAEEKINIIQALGYLANAGAAIKLISVEPNYMSALEEMELDFSLIKIFETTNDILSRISIEKLSVDEQRILAGERIERSPSLKISYIKDGNRYPLPKIKFAFFALHPDGERELYKALSDNEGKAVCPGVCIPTEKEGLLRIKALPYLIPEPSNLPSGKEAFFTFIIESADMKKVEDLDEDNQKIISYLVDELCSNLTVSDIKRVAINEITDENSNIDRLSYFLNERLMAALAKKGYFTLINQDSFKAALQKAALKTRDIIVLSPLAKACEIVNAQAIINGSYQKLGESILLQIKMEDIKNGIVLSVAETKLHNTDILSSLIGQEDRESLTSIVKNDIDKIKNSDTLKDLFLLKQDNPTFDISIYTKPKKSVFRRGEKFNICFYSERDCYLTLLDLQTSGEFYLFFPNSYQENNFLRGGKTYELAFDLEVTPDSPLGVERIKAIATTSPISLIDFDVTQSRGLVEFDIKNRGFMRDIKVLAPRLDEDGVWAETTLEFWIIDEHTQMPPDFNKEDFVN